MICERARSYLAPSRPHFASMTLRSVVRSTVREIPSVDRFWVMISSRFTEKLTGKLLVYGETLPAEERRYARNIQLSTPWTSEWDYWSTA